VALLAEMRIEIGSLLKLWDSMVVVFRVLLFMDLRAKSSFLLYSARWHLSRGRARARTGQDNQRQDPENRLILIQRLSIVGFS
jgi:hypothetical protein